MRRGAVTIKDVAEAAGVHTSTVSRALSPATRHLISAEIATRIDGVAKELGYARNAIASSLRTRRSMTVGRADPRHHQPAVPAHAARHRGRARRASSPRSSPTPTTIPTREAIGARRLLARSVDGLIMATVRRRDGISDELAAAGVPIVLVNRTADQSEVATVVADDAQGIRLMVEHLAELGHRRIAHLAGPQDLSTGAVRQRAFREAMRARKLDADDQQTGRRQGLQHRGRRPPRPSSCCAPPRRRPPSSPPTTCLALGVYEAAAALRLAIPADLSVTGFNDMPFVDRLTPPLTTIRIQHYEMGAAGGPPAAAAAGTARGARHVGPARRPAGRARLHCTAARGRLIR